MFIVYHQQPVTLHDGCPDGDGSQRKVWISLFKETPTTKNQHWKCVVVGDEQVDTGSLGPPVHALDIDNKAAIQEAMAKV